jgi:hypothetical protein
LVWQANLDDLALFLAFNYYFFSFEFFYVVSIFDMLVIKFCGFFMFVASKQMA